MKIWGPKVETAADSQLHEEGCCSDVEGGSLGGWIWLRGLSLVLGGDHLRALTVASPTSRNVIEDPIDGIETIERPQDA